MDLPITSLVLLLFLTTCRSATNTEKLVDSINNFGIKLLLDVMNGYNGNVLISPLSLSVAMSSLLIGSEGNTSREIANLFNYSSTVMTRDEIKTSFKTILDKQNKNNFKYDADFADAMWIKNGVSILPSYTSDLKNYFNTEVKQVDFTEPQSTRDINDWVDEETRGSLKSAFKTPLNKSTSVLLASANYFNGKWDFGFDAAETKMEPFYINGGQKSVLVPMMYVYGNFSYTSDIDTNAKFVEIPYDGGEMSMIIFLPNDYDGIIKMKNLTLENIKIVLSELNTIELHLRIPKFYFSYLHDVKETLKRMGVKKVFIPGEADLSDIDGQKDLSVSQVIEARSIHISEDGTKPPRVRGKVQKLTPIGYQPAKFDYFTADHPFGFLILHKPTGVIWYFGRVVSI